MKASKIKALEENRKDLSEWFDDLQSLANSVDEDSIHNMMEVFQEIESHLEVARGIIKDIRKL